MQCCNLVKWIKTNSKTQADLNLTSVQKVIVIHKHFSCSIEKVKYKCPRNIGELLKSTSKFLHCMEGLA